ncbi:hypothetical protein R1flu_000398 [Riccia fluitans]|uniref:Uncharacterized protein n=1 Tax=Riccia fluitans TaxID=41844 RepID=A0ABD1Y0J4_9MARC
MPLSCIWHNQEFEWDSSDEEWMCSSVRSGSTMFVDLNGATRFECHTQMNVNQHTSLPHQTEIGTRSIVVGTDTKTTSVDIDVNQMLQDLFHTLDFGRMEAVDEEHASQQPTEEIIDKGVFNGMPNLATAQAHEAQLRVACTPLFDGARLNVLQFVMMFLDIYYEHGVPNVAVNKLLLLKS